MKCEAFMVFGGEDDVAATGFSGQAGPGAGEVGFRFKERDGFVGIFVSVDANVLLNPLHTATGSDDAAFPRASEAGVEAPMDKHAESGLSPPFHPGIPFCFGFGRHSAVTQGHCKAS